MFPLEGYALRVGRIGGGSQGGEGREREKGREKLSSPLCCFTGLRHQVTDFTSLFPQPARRGLLSSVKSHSSSPNTELLGLRDCPLPGIHWQAFSFLSHVASSYSHRSGKIMCVCLSHNGSPSHLCGLQCRGIFLVLT